MESGRPRRTIIGLVRPASAISASVATRFGSWLPCLASVSCLVLVSCPVLVSCVAGSDDDLADADTDEVTTAPDRASEAMDELAFAATARLTPPTDPGGSRYLTCSIDYRDIDWDAEPHNVVQSHTAASAVPCAGETWYHNTAFQNGILTFMALVGEETLANAVPSSEAPEAVAFSLRAQGFDRLAAIDIASSGRCERGQVQAALFTLADRNQPVDGLEQLLASAEASGASVERSEVMTVISGGGAPCATAIVHSDEILGWVTTADAERVRLAVAEFNLGQNTP